MSEPLLSLVKACQQSCFDAEAESLRVMGKVKKRFSLLELTPFQSDDGVFRVGGRIDKPACLSTTDTRLFYLPNTRGLVESSRAFITTSTSWVSITSSCTFGNTIRFCQDGKLD